MGEKQNPAYEPVNSFERHDAWKTSDRVMAALNKTPGNLVKKTRIHGRVVPVAGIVRIPASSCNE